ncbi:MAG: RNA polymerase sigma factor [Mariniblastus sp.]
MIKLETEQFARLMEQVRAGDQIAAAELVACYEPEIRRDIRLRLTNPKLRRVVDSMDISQSVFGNFFVRAVHGEFDLQRPEQLLGLLSKMATNKVIDRHRRETVRRSHDTIDIPVDQRQIVDMQPTASDIVAGNELVSRFQARMTDDECKLAELRRDGQSWKEIAAELGGNAEALRKRLARACDRVVSELGL